MVSSRMQNRSEASVARSLPEHTEAVHVSEVEIDVSVPFVRKITMRNMTAWQNGPAPEPQDTKSSGSGIGRKIGLLGASSVFALCLGVIARKVGPFSDQNGRVIDVVGKPKS